MDITGAKPINTYLKIVLNAVGMFSPKSNLPPNKSTPSKTSIGPEQTKVGSANTKCLP